MTPDAAIAAYTPAPDCVPEFTWTRIRPLVSEAVAAAAFDSSHGARFAMRTAAQFFTWALTEGLPLDLEVLLCPERVEEWVASREGQVSRRTQSNQRSALRRVGRASTRRAPWPPEPRPYTGHVHLTGPYSASEIAGFLAAVPQQTHERRSRVLKAMLALGLGAGLTPGEVLTCTAAQVRKDPTDELLVIVASGRTVPVDRHYARDLRDLCFAHPEGPLIGVHNPRLRDPFGHLRRGIRLPAYLPPLRVSRLRTTWMVNVLQRDVRISEFMEIAGTASSKTLETIAVFVPRRTTEIEFHRRAAGL